MENAVIGLDFGSLSCRGILAGASDGRVLAEEVCPYRHGILESLPDGRGRKQLALLSFAGFVLELICPEKKKKEEDGVVAHFAVYVDDVDAAAAELQSLGIDTFLKPEKTVLPELFGGLENRFFRGPSGEQIELLHCNTFAYPD